MENKILPIKPEDVVKERAKFIPDEVFKAFNTLIARNWNGSSSTFKQEDVITLILDYKCFEEDRHRTIYKKVIYEQHLFDVEDIYREIEWKVYYDKPAYNESYAPTFCFSKKQLLTVILQ